MGTGVFGQFSLAGNRAATLHLVAALGPDSPTGHSTITTHRQGIGSFDVPTITQRRVVELLLSIPTHKATGDDGISAKLPRIAAPAISPSLSKLLNLCLSTKTFPAAWKVAKVTPFSKKMAVGTIRTTTDRFLCFLFSLKYQITREISLRRTICFIISSLVSENPIELKLHLFVCLTSCFLNSTMIKSLSLVL